MRERVPGDLVFVINKTNYSGRIGVLELVPRKPEDIKLDQDGNKVEEEPKYQVALRADPRAKVKPESTVIPVELYQVRTADLNHLRAPAADVFENLNILGLTTIIIPILDRLETTTVTFGRFLELHLLIMSALEYMADLDSSFSPLFQACRKLSYEGSLNDYIEFNKKLRVRISQWV